MDKTISIYIPVVCDGVSVYKSLLIGVLDIVNKYLEGIIIPDEIIVNITGITQSSDFNILKKFLLTCPSIVKLYVSGPPLSITENMNMAYKYTSGDIVLFHDIDFYPSIGRVFHIKKIFNSMDILLLHHIYYGHDIITTDNYNKIDFDIRSSENLYDTYFPFKVLNHCWQFCRRYGDITNPFVDIKSLCVDRDVLQNSKFLETYQLQLYAGSDLSVGQYYEFAINTLYTYNKSIIINIPLSYRGIY